MNFEEIKTAYLATKQGRKNPGMAPEAIDVPGLRRVVMMNDDVLVNGRTALDAETEIILEALNRQASEPPPEEPGEVMFVLPEGHPAKLKQVEEPAPMVSRQVFGIGDSAATVDDPNPAETIFCWTCRADVTVGQCNHVSRCKECGKLKQIGDWPICPHGAPHHRDAKAFDEILIYELPDGSHHYAGRNDDPPPINFPNAKPIRLTTLREADAFVRETNAREQYEIDIRTEARRNHADKAQRESRAQLKQELERRGISARNVDAIIADRDGRGPDKNTIMQQFEAACRETGKEFNREHFERVYDQTQRTRRNPDYRGRPQASFGIEVFEQDASNRREHRSEHTGWKGRKG